jgi:predicted ferric reductase
MLSEFRYTTLLVCVAVAVAELILFVVENRLAVEDLLAVDGHIIVVVVVVVVAEHILVVVENRLVLEHILAVVGHMLAVVVVVVVEHTRAGVERILF